MDEMNVKGVDFKGLTYNNILPGFSLMLLDPLMYCYRAGLF